MCAFDVPPGPARANRLRYLDALLIIGYSLSLLSLLACIVMITLEKRRADEIMRNPGEFLSKRHTAPPYDKRLSVFIEEYLRWRDELRRPVEILDIGCGNDCQLSSHVLDEDSYLGCDYYDKTEVPAMDYLQIDLNERGLASALALKKFDVIFCGELIEHLFSPDDLLDEVKQLMHKQSILILSTPNLGYYANRLLLLLGITPLFLENSSEAKLGRRLRALGQGKETQGHIRVFTYRAIRDLLELKGFEVTGVKSVPVGWEFPIDRLVCRASHSLAPDNVFTVKLKNTAVTAVECDRE